MIQIKMQCAHRVSRYPRVWKKPHFIYHTNRIFGIPCKQGRGRAALGSEYEILEDPGREAFEA